MVQENKRQTAHRIWLSSLDEGTFIKSEGEWEPNYIEVKGIKVSRINVIGTIVETFFNEEKLYATISLDDGTSVLRVKAWKDDASLLKDLKKGTLVLVIGKLREYQNEIYLTPEIVKIMQDPNWELLRKIQLFKMHGKPQIQAIPSDTEIRSFPQQSSLKQEPPKMIIEEMKIEEPEEKEKFKIIKVLEQSESGMNMEELTSKTAIQAEEIAPMLTTLVKEGEIYQNKPGYYKTI